LSRPAEEDLSRGLVVLLGKRDNDGVVEKLGAVLGLVPVEFNEG